MDRVEGKRRLRELIKLVKSSIRQRDRKDYTTYYIPTREGEK